MSPTCKTFIGELPFGSTLMDSRRITYSCRSMRIAQMAIASKQTANQTLASGRSFANHQVEGPLLIISRTAPRASADEPAAGLVPTTIPSGTVDEYTKY